MENRDLRVTQVTRGKPQYFDEQHYFTEDPGPFFYESLRCSRPHKLASEGYPEGEGHYLYYLDQKRSWLSTSYLECLTCKSTVVEERLHYFVEDGDIFRALIEAAYQSYEPDLSDQQGETESLHFDPYGNPVSKGMLKLADKILAEEHCVVLHRRIAATQTPPITFEVVNSDWATGPLDPYIPSSALIKIPEEMQPYYCEFFSGFKKYLMKLKVHIYQVATL